MKVLIDTSIWSIALRKSVTNTEFKNITMELTHLIKDSRAIMLGVIRQEILSGIKTTSQFEKLKLYLRSFPDLVLEMNDYEVAAAFYNQCRGKGIQGSHIDFLISAVAVNRDLPVFTMDRDFEYFSRCLSLKLYLS